MDPTTAIRFDYFDDTTELLNRKSSLLRSFLGQRLNNSHIVWNSTGDYWNNLSVIILEFGSDRLEVCCSHLDRLSVLKNSTDLSSAPSVDWDPEDRYEWKQNAVSEINPLRGQILNNIQVVEYEFCTWPPEEEKGGPNTTSCWVLFGLWLEFDQGQLLIHNALDEVGVANNIDQPDAIRLHELLNQ
jgi:hypothetical protein